ncbi:ice-binding family protein [Solirubrobacter phytolaccae]|uniref:Ice-binding family protein n=1 Tax=Solirubrobacter phytolaccae TaxID=1404360 RepID=A0A9X3N2X3_9ACTN|nr:ice-binding family protein [Solirubrobacter phytolaccae]MDA0178763.1 ice-binding family protein [Solirubrobacter phytolaccae]
MGTALAVGCAFVAVPAAASAAPVDLATAKPFVVLGGSAVTNTGPSVLNGELGVSPGTALTGFGIATLNGAVHNNDAVAAQAQLDLTNAYGVAAGQPLTVDLSGTDLGGLVLTPGAYRFTSSAQLTGTLTLDAQNDPAAQFVFQIGSALTTASVSRVSLVGAATPCNVYWQVGTSATLDTGTAFQGNLMAAASISLNNAATVQGRLLASSGQISLINNVIDASMCAATPTTPTDTSTTGPPSTGTGTGSGSGSGGAAPTGPGAGGTAVAPRRGTAVWTRTTPRARSGQPACADGFNATLRGRQIKRVVFRLDGRVVRGTTKSPFRLFVRGLPGRHKVTARVTFKDATPARTLSLNYRACASVALRPTYGPSQFTG